MDEYYREFLFPVLRGTAPNMTWFPNGMGLSLPSILGLVLFSDIAKNDKYLIYSKLRNIIIL